MLFINDKEKDVMVRIKEEKGYRWLAVSPGEEVDLSEDVGLKNGLVIAASIEDEKSVEDKEPEEAKNESLDNKKDENGKYSKTDLFDFTKKEQVNILKDLKVEEKDIKKLKKEEERVNKILELQDAEDN